MTDVLKIVLEKGDHWSLGILIFAILILGLLKLPIFKDLNNIHAHKMLTNLLWAIVGISALYILIVLLRDMSKNSKEIELARIQASIKNIEANSAVIRSDSALMSQYKRANQHIISDLSSSGSHPIEDARIDHSKCWIAIKPFANKSLVKKPHWQNKDVIATNIPEGVYYVITRKKEPEFGKLFFKIRLANGLEGWVLDWNLDKNPKCYD